MKHYVWLQGKLGVTVQLTEVLRKEPNKNSVLIREDKVF